MDERIITQASRCQDKFISKASYYKDKYIHLISLVTCSVGIIFTTIFYSNRLSNDVAVLKDNMKSLKAAIKEDGKILLQETEHGYFFYASKKKMGNHGKEKMPFVQRNWFYYCKKRHRCLLPENKSIVRNLWWNRGRVVRLLLCKPSNKGNMLRCITSSLKEVKN